MKEKSVMELSGELGVAYHSLYYWINKAQAVFPDIKRRRKATCKHNPLTLTIDEQSWIIPRALGQCEYVCICCGDTYYKLRGQHTNINSKTLCAECYKKDVNRRQAAGARIRRQKRRNSPIDFFSI